MADIRILIADDHTIVRTGLAALLDSESGIKVVGEAADGEAAIQKAKELRPDVVVMDIRMPICDGIHATEEIRRNCPDTQVLILTTSTVSDELARALKAGAIGIVAKTTDNTVLVDAIRDVAAGVESIPADIRSLLKQDPPSPELTARQIEILHSVTRGFSNDDIAKQLNLAKPTIKSHLKVIYAKLGVATRAEAVSLAIRKNLLQDF